MFPMAGPAMNDRSRMILDLQVDSRYDRNGGSLGRAVRLHAAIRRRKEFQMTSTSTHTRANRTPPQKNMQPRMILVDDNIRTVGGHFFELASLLSGGAAKMGYRPVIATHASFSEVGAVPRGWTVVPTFRVRRMVRWSLGVDGRSKGRRDFGGNPVDGSFLYRVRTRVSDLLNSRNKRPAAMAAQYREDLGDLLRRLKPNATDVLVVNTADDFAFLAVADAISRANLPAMAIHAVFHFALAEPSTVDPAAKLRMIGHQLRQCLQAMKPHTVHLHATTDALADQLRRTDCGQTVDSIAYPTRARTVVAKAETLPLKAVLAGIPRAEKGRGAIAEVLAGIEGSLLKSGSVQLSMQMPPKRWESMVPKSLHRAYQQAVDASVKDEVSTGPLEVMTANLSTDVYHRWLDSADLGLFLYDADRYVARCSGVLLEMMARGVPVIVPDHCWLAEQVRLAGGHRSIGFIYQHRSEVPELMRQFVKHRTAIQARAIEHAKKIAERHAATSTLLMMGLRPIERTTRAA